jgi:hypothetical protein
MYPDTSLPRDDAAEKYVKSVTTGGATFPRDKSDWHSDLETAYQQGWEDAIAWFNGQRGEVSEEAST